MEFGQIRKLAGKLPVIIIKEQEDVFVAYTPALDLSSCGASLDEALKRFAEAVEIFFGECVSRGTLAEVLESLGWKQGEGPSKTLSPPEVVGHFDVPVPVLAD